MSHGGSWLTVTDVPVSQANQLLGASYRLYRNTETNDTTVRTVGYALPTVLHTCIRTVAPTTYFPSTRGMRQTINRRPFGAAPAQAPAAPGNVVAARQDPQDPGITPSVLRWLYKAESYKPLVPLQNTIGILGIDNEYPNRLDLARFLGRYRSDARNPGYTQGYTVTKLNGGKYDPRTPGVEASIGTQYASAMAYPIPLVFYSVGGDAAWGRDGEPTITDMYLEWLQSLLHEDHIPQTIVISYAHSEQELPIQYASFLCKLFATLGVRGVTVLVSSGNAGVGGGNCVNADGLVQFMPEFPSSCTCGVVIPSEHQTSASISHSPDCHGL